MPQQRGTPGLMIFCVLGILIVGGMMYASPPAEIGQDIRDEPPDCNKDDLFRYVVCSDEELSRWDARMFRYNDEAFRNSTGLDRQNISERQDQWFQYRTAKCDTTRPDVVSCVLGITKSRVMELEKERK